MVKKEESMIMPIILAILFGIVIIGVVFLYVFFISSNYETCSELQDEGYKSYNGWDGYHEDCLIGGHKGYENETCMEEHEEGIWEMNSSCGLVWFEMMGLAVIILISGVVIFAVVQFGGRN